jgi:hypothetical protein
VPPPAIPGTLFVRPLATVIRGSAEAVVVLMDLDELVDHWTLLKDEQELVAGKRGPTRLADAQQRYDDVIGDFPSDQPDHARLGRVTRFLPAPRVIGLPPTVRYGSPTKSTAAASVANPGSCSSRAQGSTVRAGNQWFPSLGGW